MNTADVLAAKTAQSFSEEKIDKCIESITAECLKAAGEGLSELHTDIQANPVEKDRIAEKLIALGFTVGADEEGRCLISWAEAKPALPRIAFSKGDGYIAFEDCDGERQVIFAPYEIRNLCVEHCGDLRRLALYANGEVYELARSSELSIQQMNLLSEAALKDLLTKVGDLAKKK